MSRRWIALIAAAFVAVIGIAAGITFVGLRAQQQLLASGATLPTVRPLSTSAVSVPSPSTSTPAPTAPEFVATSTIAATLVSAATPTLALSPELITTQETPTVALSRDPVPLRPSRVIASDTAPPSKDDRGVQTTFVATNTVDGDLETAWRVPGNGVSQTLTLTFDTPVRISTIELVPGYAKVDKLTGTDRFMQNRRVLRVRFEFSSGEPVEGMYVEQPVLQPTAAGDVLTTFVRIVILETTPPGRNDGRDYTPISEVVVKGIESVR